jgi:transposase
MQSFIDAQMTRNPFLTSMELSALLFKSFNLKSSPSTCWRAIKSLNYTRKRTRVKVSRVSNTPYDMKTFSREFMKEGRLISIDESSFYFNDAPKYGYSKRGSRLVTTLSENPRKQRISLFMAVSRDEIVGYQILYGNGSTDTFLTFLKSIQFKDNDRIVLDNVAFHKAKKVRDFLNGKHIDCLFIKPYSPEYNPIEMVFSKVKYKFRQQHLTSSDKSFESRIVQSLNLVTSEDLTNYFAHVIKILKMVNI